MIVKIEIINPIDLSNLHKIVGEKLIVTQKTVARKIISDAKQIIKSELNDKHQHIRESLKSKVSNGGLTTEIYIDEKNLPAIYQHEGTKDHNIAVVNKKALYWVSGGQKHFSKKHRVKGVKPVKFLKKAVESNKSFIIDEIKKVNV